MPIEKIQNKFSFGFEIEGFFSGGLLCDLGKLSKTGLDIAFKCDGSVRNPPQDFEASHKGQADEWVYGINDVEFEEGEFDRKHLDFMQDGSLTELNIGIFDNLEKMIEILDWFKFKKNHYQNTSCGLHVHIKPVSKEDQILFNPLIRDYEFISLIQKYAFDSLSPAVRQRKENKNCIPFGELNASWRRIQHHDKYAFVNHHSEYKTFEFRFFSAGPSKVDDVTKFFEFFFAELAKVKPTKKASIVVPLTQEDHLVSEECTLDIPVEKIKITHIIQAGERLPREPVILRDRFHDLKALSSNSNFFLEKNLMIYMKRKGWKPFQMSTGPAQDIVAETIENEDMDGIERYASPGLITGMGTSMHWDYEIDSSITRRPQAETPDGAYIPIRERQEERNREAERIRNEEISDMMLRLHEAGSESNPSST